MRDYKLNEYHDRAIENNDFVVVDGLDEMAQAVRVKLLTVQGENVYDGNDGVPWNHGMFQTWMTQAERKLRVKKAALSVKGVLTVDEIVYSQDRENHSDLIELELDTVEGKISGIGA